MSDIGGVGRAGPIWNSRSNHDDEQVFVGMDGREYKMTLRETQVAHSLQAFHGVLVNHPLDAPERLIYAVDQFLSHFPHEENRNKWEVINRLEKFFNSNQPFLQWTFTNTIKGLLSYNNRWKGDSDTKSSEIPSTAWLVSGAPFPGDLKNKIESIFSTKAIKDKRGIKTAIETFNTWHTTMMVLKPFGGGSIDSRQANLKLFEQVYTNITNIDEHAYHDDDAEEAFHNQFSEIIRNTFQQWQS